MRDYRKLKKTELINMARSYELSLEGIRTLMQTEIMTNHLLALLLDDIDSHIAAGLTSRSE